MFIYKSTLDALASAMEDCTQNRDSEQEDENYYEETTEQKENKIAKQEKCKRLLPAIIESLMESLETILWKYRKYLENDWDYETFEENEKVLDGTAKDAEWYCNYHSNLLKWGWKKESEDSWGL
jgi:translation initiation factor 2 alpha subunit (eIF-2alpha)